MSVVTRFAPSPTGFLHVGGLRTALYNFLFAKQQGGTFALRIEDTDQTRLVPGAVDSLLRTLSTMGLSYDAGPIVQSERLAIYQSHAKKLVEQGSAYYCFCSKDRLEQLRETQQSSKQQTKYDRACLQLSREEIHARLDRALPHVIRLLVPEGKTTFEDMIRGTIEIDNQEIDDQVLLKTDGFPTYHLAVVVDDHEMKVTHIIRGDEWISSVPKHVMLYRAFGFSLPVFAHLPLILNPDKTKLSKRQGDVAVEDYLTKGYLPETLINFVALLGFNPTADREIYSLPELIELFDLSKINKSGAVFDHAKLDWMNGQYLRTKTLEELQELAKPFLDELEVTYDVSFLHRILTVEHDRLTILSEIPELVKVYQSLPAYDAEMLVWKKSDPMDAKSQLRKLSELLRGTKETIFEDQTLIEQTLKGYIEREGLQNGNVLWPLRVALSGREKSPGPFELLWLFGKGESLNRITRAIERLT